ncbi:TetR family transcriptional regulator [Nocardia crassostreae]|uniref:TetR family transcriptional regulator n=1 Tax=Nocardia crassostreae TaxID=53428 RepID=UPI0008321594|nr:TetR family transcriptional regulator [Nocardia crassostreae]
MSAQTAAPPLGLRERKKQQTRQHISDIATGLFLERGFESVTIAEIAAAADVAKMTVTNYFPRKEDLVLDRSAEFAGWPARTVREREPGESALAALRRAYLASVAEQDRLNGFAPPEFARLMISSPALVARVREFHDERERVLAAELAAETGIAETDFAPRIAATLLTGVHRILFDETLRRNLAGEPHSAIAAVMTGYVAESFDALEPSLGDYAVRPR